MSQLIIKTGLNPKCKLSSIIFSLPDPSISRTSFYHIYHCSVTDTLNN